MFVAQDRKTGKDVGGGRKKKNPDALEQRQHRFFTAAGRKQTYMCPRLSN